MLTKFVNWLTPILFSARKADRHPWLGYKAVFQFPVLTILIIALAHSYFVYQSLTKMIFERRQAIAHFAGIALKERLDTVIEVGLSLSIWKVNEEMIFTASSGTSCFAKRRFL